MTSLTLIFAFLELKRSRFDVTIDLVQAADEFSAHLSSNQYDVILADYQLQGWNGMYAFEMFQPLGCKAP